MSILHHPWSCVRTSRSKTSDAVNAVRKSYAGTFVEIPSVHNSITIITDGSNEYTMSDSVLIAGKVNSDPNQKQEGDVTDNLASGSDIAQLKTIYDVEEHFNVLKDALEVTSRAFHELWDRNGTLQRQNDALVKERDELMVRGESSRNELEELRRSYSTAKQYIDRARAIEEENRQIVLELQYLKESAGQSESLREELRRLQASMADLERQLLASKRDREEELEKNRELTATNQSLNQSLCELKGQRDRTEERCTQLDNALRDSIVERQRLETDRNRIIDEFQNMKNEYEALKRDYGRLPKITF